MGELAETLRPTTRPRLPLRELDWATCDDCGCVGALARASEEGAVYDYTPGICLNCGAVMCADVGEEGASWVVKAIDDIDWEPVRVRPLTLAAARRLAGWPREAWWDRVVQRPDAGGGA